MKGVMDELEKFAAHNRARHRPQRMSCMPIHLPPLDITISSRAGGRPSRFVPTL